MVSEPRRRVVLLGASNLARGMPTVVETIRTLFEPPVEIFAAHGHGRSYGLTSSMFGRQLPGIVDCQLWPALEAAPPAPTYALLTDIGNDLAYGAPVARILDWVETCLDRLAPYDAQVALTELPLAALRRLPAWRFRLLRALFFPARTFDLPEVLSQAEALNAGLARIAAEREIRLIQPEIGWYGFDPIHIHRRHLWAAWELVFAAWRESDASRAKVRPSFARRLYLRTRVPAARRLWGIAQCGAQPCARWSDGTTVSFY